MNIIIGRSKYMTTLFGVNIAVIDLVYILFIYVLCVTIQPFQLSDDGLSYSLFSVCYHSNHFYCFWRKEVLAKPATANSTMLKFLID